MTILEGGAFGAGALTPGDILMSWNILSPTYKLGGVQRFDSYFSIVDDPLGRPYRVAQSKINQSAYDLGYVNQTNRAECQGNLQPWGVIYTYYWRLLFPPNWVSLGASSAYNICQLHEMDGPAANHVPTFRVAVYDSTMNFIQAKDNDTPANVNTFFTLPVTPGREVEIFAKIKWSDGVIGDPESSTYGHVPASEGIYEWWVDGLQVYTANGVRNIWKSMVSGNDVAAPFMGGGVYLPGPDYAWNLAKETTMYYIAMARGDSNETANSIRTYVDTQLAANPNRGYVSSY